VNPKSALSNIILVSLSPNFRFYMYGVNCQDRTGKLIDTRRRRQELFFRGLLGPGEGLLTKMDLSAKELESVKRGVFFEGSYCFSSRRIPGLEKENLPKTLIASEARADNPNMLVSQNGDSIKIMKYEGYLAPEILKEGNDDFEKRAAESSVPLARIDGRCGDCTSFYKKTDALMSHCRETGHSPLTNGIDNEIPANREMFLAYCNVALQRAMGERMARWGREYIDPKNFTEPMDRNGKKLGVKVFRAYTCEFGLAKPLVGESKDKLCMSLTVDLRAKLLRTKSVLETICDGRDPNTIVFDAHQQNMLLDKWRNEVIICTYDKKCYSVIDLLFDHSPASKPVDGLGMSHADYFVKKKGLPLRFPNAKPLLAVLGRNNSTIYLPAELVCGNDLEPSLRMKLPSIASFKPCQRHEAIEEMKRFLKPGGQKTKGVGGGLLPALGIILQEERLEVPVEVLPLPTIIAAGVKVTERHGKMWAPLISKARFNVNPNDAVCLNVIVVYHQELERKYLQVYERLRDLINNLGTSYTFSQKPFACVRAGDLDKHWETVENYFRRELLPDNIFVIDFSKPPRRSSSDPAYSVVKRMLGQAGFLSQFINFNTHDHGNMANLKKSNIILQGVARQVLSKCGVRIWWVNIPRALPLPAIFVGVDVFHAPRKYDPIQKKRTAKESVAAIIVQVLRSNNPDDSPNVEIYSETARRVPGQEMELGDLMHKTVSRALKVLDVNPLSCIVWRDGVGDTTINKVAQQEIPVLREALLRNATNGVEPALSYVVCQKRVATKFLTEDGKKGMPPGALITAIQGPENETFYINGTSPPYSTPKPVRYIVAQKDKELEGISLSELSWALCHDYPNWAGPVKLPAPVQMAHKLAELAGGFVDCGDSLNAEAYANKMHFL